MRHMEDYKMTSEVQRDKNRGSIIELSSLSREQTRPIIKGQGVGSALCPSHNHPSVT